MSTSPNTIAPVRLRTVEEAAGFLHCCTATVRRLAMRGELRGQKVGNRWRFSDELVQSADQATESEVCTGVA